jgi:hypothetical protein
MAPPILGYSILNVMRLNAARLNYGPATVYITIATGGGAGSPIRARLAGAQIRDIINASPSTALFRVSDAIPPVTPPFVAPQPGQDVAIAIGTTAPQSAIFTGQILRRAQVKEGIYTNPPAFDCECTDYTWQLDRRLAFGVYAAVSASTVAADLLARFAPGFTTAIEAGLPAVTLTFTGQPLSECLSQVVNAIGGRWKVLAKVVHVYLSATHLSPPDPVTGLTCTDFVETLDLAQVRSRIYVHGIGVLLTAPAAAGATAVQLADVTPFLVPGSGSVISDDGQILTYTGAQAAGYAPGVPLGGPTIPPPAAPVPIAAADPPAVPVNFTSYTANAAYFRIVTTVAHGFVVGDYVVFTDQALVLGAVSAIVSATEFQIAVTPGPGGSTTNGGTVRKGTQITAIKARQGTATLTSATPHNLAPGVSIAIMYATVAAFMGRWTIATTPTPTTATFSLSGAPADATLGAFVRTTAGSLVGTYQYKTTLASDTAETAPSAASSAITIAAVTPIDLTGWNWVMTDLGGSVESINKGLYPQNNYWYVVTAIDSAGHETAYAAFKTINTTTVPTTINAQRVTWSIPAGWDNRIVAINVWRTAIRGSAPTDPSQYGFVGTVTIPANGNATSFADEVRDSARGGPPPSANTTGGAVIVTQVAIGDPRVQSRRIYRNTAAAPTVFQRAGEVNDNSTTAWLDQQLDAQLTTPAPTTPVGTFGAPGQLTGIPASGTGAIARPLVVGAPLSLWLQRDDTAAQSALAALEGGDGIHESRIDDPTIATVAAAQAAADADLKLFNKAEAKCTFSGRDSKLQAGATVSVNFGAPTNLTNTYVIQSVTITELGIPGTTPPKRTVEAATTRYTLDDLLRRVALLEGQG